MRTDAELLAAARKDPTAFRLFYERHAEAVFSWFRRRARSSEDAMDLTAETFAQALRSLPRFRSARACPDGSARAWLHGIARHVLASYRRQGRVDAQVRARLGIPHREYDLDELERIENRDELETIRPALRAARPDRARAPRLR
jgi:RNA polymerase sigma factor (sigma-70 family)